jgi:fused signal recognition particle receptor
MAEVALWIVGLVALAAAGWWVVRTALAGGQLPRVGEAPAPTDPSPTRASPMLAALARTRELFAGLLGRSAADEAAMAALEEALIRADVGARTAAAMVAEVRGRPDLIHALREAVRGRLEKVARPLNARGERPHVVLVVGVNGSGKTTTIGKLAARYRGEGASVVLGAADTFRAGAIEQLKVWGERAGAEVVAQREGADPAAVAHQAVEAARARGADVVICDTAGRLQAQKALMDELAKVRRVIGRLVPGAPHETLLVLDATMGQNALSQARLFGEVAGVTGVVLTKLDGTARGGVVVAIAEEFGLPVKLVGVGEKIDDLRDFDVNSFVDGVLGSGPGVSRE